jgi:hypothetical protein
MGGAATLGTIAIAETFHKPAPKILEIDGRLEDLQRIANLADPLKMFRQPEKRPLFHRPISKSATSSGRKPINGPVGFPFSCDRDSSSFSGALRWAATT